MRELVKNALVLFTLLLMSLAISCREPSMEMDEYDLEDQRLVEFYFDSDENASLDGKYEASFEGSIVYISVPDGTDRSSLIPRFKIRGKGMQVDGVWQNSGSSVQDFSSSVVYDLIKTDGSRIQYSVVVGYGEMSGNQLYEFGFTVADNMGNLWENVTGIQNGNNIIFYFPYGTTMIDFVPSFTAPAGTEVRYEGIPLSSGMSPFVNPGEGGVISVVFSDGSSKAFTVRADIKSREAVYVQEGAVGTLGTQQDPLGDIASAYTMAQTEGIGEIRISEGIYTLGTQLVISSNIKIKGGYNPSDWSDRYYTTPSARTDPTYGVIIDCSDGTAGTAYDFKGGILFTGGTVNESTLLEGVNVTRSGGADYCSAVSVRDGASPVIRFADCYGPLVTNSAAVFINGASPRIFSGILKGDGNTNLSMGISVYGDSEPEVVSCFISSTNGSSSSQGFGLDLDGGAGGQYINNFIEGEGWTEGSAVRLMTGGGEFYNNIFSLNSVGGIDILFKENSSGNSPDALKNNVFNNDDGGSDVLYQADGFSDYKTAAEVNAIASGISGNYAYLFANEIQYEIDAVSSTIPPVVAYYGTVPGTSWSRDLYGNDRSSSGSQSWSIGPIEVDYCSYDTQYVGFNSGADGSYDGDWSSLSISEAIVLANSWGTIEVIYETSGGGYTISSPPEMKITSDLVIVNENPTVTFWPPSGQAVFFIDDEDSGNEIDVFIKGFTFSNIFRSSEIGGAVLSRENTYLYNCIFTGNQAEAGAGLYQDGGVLYLANTVFYNNSALNGPGGGIYAVDSNVNGFNLVFTENDVVTGGNGAAAYFESSPASLVNSTFTYNDATSTTAAVYAQNSDLSILNSVFSENTGGIGLVDTVCSGGTLTLYGSIMQSATFSTWPGVTQTLSSVGFLDITQPLLNGWTDSSHTFHAADNAQVVVDHGTNSYIPQDWPDADGDGNTTEDFPYDMAGDSRIIGGNVDAGAYESY